MRKKLIKTLCLALVCAAALFALASCGTKTVNIADYVTVTFDGADGYGTAYAYFDNDSFYDAVAAVSKDKSYTEIMQYVLYWGNNVHVELDRYSSLSNGDKVTCTITYGSHLAEKLGVKLIPADGKTFDVTVEGLAELSSIDLFTDIESMISLSGTSPYGSLQIQSSTYQRVSYTADKTENISNGDVITITASAGYSYDNDLDKLCAECYNGIPETDTYQYTVSGLDTYVTSIDQIPESLLTDMQKQAVDVIVAYTADAENSRWTGGFQMNGNPEYVGLYLMSAKKIRIFSDINRIYLMYKLNASNNDTTMDYYFFVQYSDAIIYGDGIAYVDTNNTVIPSGSLASNYGTDYFSTGDHGFVGFRQLGDFEHRYLRTNQDSYNWTTNIQ